MNTPSETILEEFPEETMPGESLDIMNLKKTWEEGVYRMDFENLNKIWHEVESLGLKLTILMAGKTGVGKSTVINAVIQAEVSQVSQDGTPCTKKNEETIWASDMGDISIIDVPGFGEANAPKIDTLNYQENIRKIGKHAHILLLVLKCDDKALELEEQFLTLWLADGDLQKVPIIVVVNQIDKMKPVREWNPETLNLSSPTTEKERNICSYLKYLSTIPTFQPYYDHGKVFPVSAGEYYNDPKYGFEQLTNAIQNELPNVFKLFFDRTQKAKEEKALTIIHRYSMVCGGIAIQPVPILDSILLAPVQVAMVASLARLHGISLSKGLLAGILNTVLLAVGGNTLFLAAIKFVPGIGSVLGPALGYGLAYTSGLVVNELFSSGNLNPSDEEAKILAEKYKIQGKKAAQEYKNTVKLKKIAAQ